MNIGLKRIDWVKEQKFWCNECDENVVDSTNPETGHFYMMFGHIYKPSSKISEFGTDKSIGDSTSIIFALCSDCEK